MTNKVLLELADRVADLCTAWGDMVESEKRDAIANQLRTAASGVGEAFLYVREIDAGTDNACWVVGNAVDPGAIPVFDSPTGAEARDAVTLADINAAFNNEIDRVSTLEFNSNEICRAFYRNLLKRINPDWDPAMQEAALRARD